MVETSGVGVRLTRDQRLEVLIVGVGGFRLNLDEAIEFTEALQKKIDELKYIAELEYSRRYEDLKNE